MTKNIYWNVFCNQQRAMSALGYAGKHLGCITIEHQNQKEVLKLIKKNKKRVFSSFISKNWNNHILLWNALQFVSFKDEKTLRNHDKILFWIPSCDRYCIVSCGHCYIPTITNSEWSRTQLYWIQSSGMNSKHLRNWRTFYFHKFITWVSWQFLCKKVEKLWLPGKLSSENHPVQTRF